MRFVNAAVLRAYRPLELVKGDEVKIAGIWYQVFFESLLAVRPSVNGFLGFECLGINGRDFKKARPEVFTYTQALYDYRRFDAHYKCTRGKFAKAVLDLMEHEEQHGIVKKPIFFGKIFGHTVYLLDGRVTIGCRRISKQRLFIIWANVGAWLGYQVQGHRCRKSFKRLTELLRVGFYHLWIDPEKDCLRYGFRTKSRKTGEYEYESLAAMGRTRAEQAFLRLAKLYDYEVEG